MQLFKTRTNTVEAVQLDAENVESVAEWCGARIVEEIDPRDSDIKYVALNVPTHDGNQRCSQGQYVVRGPGGFSIKGASAFEREFESV